VNGYVDDTPILNSCMPWSLILHGHYAYWVDHPVLVAKVLDLERRVAHLRDIEAKYKDDDDPVYMDDYDYERLDQWQNLRRAYYAALNELPEMHELRHVMYNKLPGDDFDMFETRLGRYMDAFLYGHKPRPRASLARRFGFRFVSTWGSPNKVHHIELWRTSSAKSVTALVHHPAQGECAAPIKKPNLTNVTVAYWEDDDVERMRDPDEIFKWQIAAKTWIEPMRTAKTKRSLMRGIQTLLESGWRMSVIDFIVDDD
jgi:hypothetical protein